MSSIYACCDHCSRRPHEDHSTGHLTPCSATCTGSREVAHGLREGAASATDAETGPELHPRNSIALESESKVGTNEAHWATLERETYYEAANETRDRLLAAYESVFDLRRDVERMAADLLAKDATIERLWRQLNEATNVPDHCDPEFGFDKTAALSEGDEASGALADLMAEAKRVQRRSPDRRLS